jgi:hypothetical protein
MLHGSARMIPQDVLLLQRFSGLVYSQTISGSPYQSSITRHGSNPRGN